MAWADASVVRIRGNNAGQALLEVRGQGRQTSAYLPLVAADLGGDRSQSPEFLNALADQIERWAPQRAAVVKQLRRRLITWPPAAASGSRRWRAPTSSEPADPEARYPSGGETTRQGVEQ